MNETPNPTPISPLRPAEDTMRTWERIAALVYLAVHLFALPFGVSWLLTQYPALTEVQANCIYFGIGALFSLAVLGRYLRRSFDALLDRLLLSIASIFGAWGLQLVLTLLALAVTSYLLPGMEEGLDTRSFIEISTGAYRKLIYLSILLAPLVEVPCLCAALFGGLAKKSRALAYLVTCLVYALGQTWQYAWAANDPGYLLYGILMFPACAALCRCFERSGSVWTPIFYQMLFSATALLAL